MACPLPLLLWKNQRLRGACVAWAPKNKLSLKPLRTLCSYTLSRQLYGTDDVCVCVALFIKKLFANEGTRGPKLGKLRDVARHY